MDENILNNMTSIYTLKGIRALQLTDSRNTEDLINDAEAIKYMTKSRSYSLNVFDNSIIFTCGDGVRGFKVNALDYVYTLGSHICVVPSHVFETNFLYEPTKSAVKSDAEECLNVFGDVFNDFFEMQLKKMKKK